MSSQQPHPTATYIRFADWRLHFGSVSKEAKHTVDVVIKTARRKYDYYKAEQILSNLTELNLENNQISDLTPLQSLTNLTELNLENNQISDLTPLQSLTNLTNLNLENNQISDVTSLQSLTNLTNLNLENNSISDLTPLKYLTRLTYLNLSHNQISDLTPLKYLTRLTYLNLSHNQISDLRPLQSLTCLTNLNLENNQISDLTPLKSLTILTYLNLSHNQISDLRLLQSLTYLANLNLYNNQISDLTPLQSLTNLTNLNLYNNQISDLTPLQSLTNLTNLNLLDNNQISDLTPLQSLTNLTNLNLPNNQISDLTPLQSLWTAIANSTDPVDRTRATAVIELAYAALGKTCPKIIFCSSPHSAITQLKQLNSPTNKNEKSHFYYKQLEQVCLPFKYIIYCCLYVFVVTRGERPLKTDFFQLFYEQLESACRPFNLIRYSSSYLPELIRWEPQLEQELRRDFSDDWNNSRPTVTRASLLGKICVADFCVSVLRIVLNPAAQKAFECLQQLLVECGWIFAFDKVCLVCDRPSKLSLDSEHRLHAEGESAIEFSDGYKLYSYHGVTLPEKYGQVHPNQWQATWILEENNAELRRVLIQEIGYARICQELQATELDCWQEYTLLRIDADIDGFDPQQKEPIYLLKMTCPSTGFIHALRVPPQMQSAREAIRWVNWDVDYEEFSVQT